jgi:hypothetical protein
MCVAYVHSTGRLKFILNPSDCCRVGDVVSNSRVHRLCTSSTFSNFQYHFKINLLCSKVNRSSALRNLRVSGSLRCVECGDWVPYLHIYHNTTRRNDPENHLTVNTVYPQNGQGSPPAWGLGAANDLITGNGRRI